MRKHLPILALASLPLFSAPAAADLLCDCTQVIDSCSASVSLDGMQVNIESSNDSCSRVDYLIEGQPYTALVVGGEGSLPWTGQPLRNAGVVVENCRVCAENTGEVASAAPGGDNADTAAEDEAAGELTSLIKIMPNYPREAWMNSLEGDVLVEFSVNQQGVVQNIKVVSSSSPLFDLPVIDAVSRFRYVPASQDGQPVLTQGLRERFYFRILDNGSLPTVTSSAG